MCTFIGRHLTFFLTTLNFFIVMTSLTGAAAVAIDVGLPKLTKPIGRVFERAKDIDHKLSSAGVKVIPEFQEPLPPSVEKNGVYVSHCPAI